MDQAQAKFIKSALGFNPNRCRATALLQTTRTTPISDTIHIQRLDLLRMSLLSDANAQQFYVNALTNHAGYEKKHISRVLSICNNRIIDFMSNVFNDNYRNTCKKNLRCHSVDGQNGLVDT